MNHALAAYGLCFSLRANDIPVKELAASIKDKSRINNIYKDLYDDGFPGSIHAWVIPYLLNDVCGELGLKSLRISMDNSMLPKNTYAVWVEASEVKVEPGAFAHLSPVLSYAEKSVLDDFAKEFFPQFSPGWIMFNYVEEDEDE